MTAFNKIVTRSKLDVERQINSIKEDIAEIEANYERLPQLQALLTSYEALAQALEPFSRMHCDDTKETV